MFNMTPEELQQFTWQLSQYMQNNVTAIYDTISTMQQKMDEDRRDTIVAIDSSWTLLTSTLVFLMQAGFGFLEAGSVRMKNANTVLLMCVTDVCVTSIMWFFIGNAVSLGSGENPVFGFDFEHWAGPVVKEADLINLFHVLVFASVSTTIVSGAVAERMLFVPYILASMWFTGLVFPIAVYWCWNAGFLGPIKGIGYIDFAGSGVVHVMGGATAVVGAVIVGKRKGRWEVVAEEDSGDAEMNHGADDSEFEGHSVILSSIGAILLWFSWFGFNAGSTVAMAAGKYQSAAVCMMTTLLAASSAVLSSFIIGWVLDRSLKYMNILNSLLAGLVAITAGCATIPPYLAPIVGFLAALTYRLFIKLERRLGIDDPCDAGAVHFLPGILGGVLPGFMSKQSLIDLAYGTGVINYEPGHQLGVQIGGTLLLAGYAIGMAIPCFLFLKWAIGIRADDNDQLTGLDFKYHRGYIAESMNKRIQRAKKQMEMEKMVEAKVHEQMVAKAVEKAKKEGSKEKAKEHSTSAGKGQKGSGKGNGGASVPGTRDSTLKTPATPGDQASRNSALGELSGGNVSHIELEESKHVAGDEADGGSGMSAPSTPRSPNTRAISEADTPLVITTQTPASTASIFPTATS